MPLFAPEILEINTQEYIGNNQHHKGILFECGAYVSMQQTMKSPLRTTAGTLISGNQQKGTLWEKRLCLRVKTVKQKECRYEQQAHDETRYNFYPFTHGQQWEISKIIPAGRVLDDLLHITGHVTGT